MLHHSTTGARGYLPFLLLEQGEIREMITFAQFMTATTFIFGILAAYFGVKSHQRDDKKDNANVVTVITTVQVQLETIKDGICELKNEFKAAKEDIKELREKVVILEQSAKSAHHRLDEHEKRLENRSDDRK
jgi:peptidoglycan hydrolase CwlO-like protein